MIFHAPQHYTTHHVTPQHDTITTMKTPSQIKTSVENITPEMASQILQVNLPNQRSASPVTINAYANDMRLGKWQLNGEPIIFDDDGHLIDGQHRLRALIKSGVALDFVVVRGASSSSFHTIDRGRVRTNGNMFQIAGVPSGNIIAAIVNAYWLYKRATKSGGALATNIRPHSGELLDLYNSHPDSFMVAVKCRQLCKTLIPSPPIGMAASAALIDRNHSEDSVIEFWSQVSKGEGLFKGDPAFMLRERLMENKSSTHKMPMNFISEISIRAWNAFIQGKKLRTLKPDYGPCPVVL
jgi:hypothetical protein